MAEYFTLHYQHPGRIIYLLLSERKPKYTEESIFTDTINRSAVRILYKPSLRLGSLKYPFSLFILQQIFSIRPAIVLAFLRRPAVVSLFCKFLFFWRNFKVIVSEDSLLSLSLVYENPSRFLRFLFHSLIRFFYPKAWRIVTPSETAKQDLIQNFLVPPERIVVNKNWVVWKDSEPSSTILFDLLYAGRVDPEKNITLFVRIVNEVRKLWPEIRVCIVGGGSESMKIARLIHSYGLDSTISMAGLQKDVARYYKVSKIFCLTSSYEGLPVAGLEAMYYGLPVVTTNYNGAEELVQDGKMGYVCPDEQRYINCIIELLTKEDLRVQIGIQAQEYVRAHHGEENLRKMMELLIEESEDKR